MPVRWRWLCLLSILFVAASTAAAEVAERPYLVALAPRMDRLLDSLDVLLDVADRPELSDVLAERYRKWGEFAGIDRTRPLGLMRTWQIDDPATIETEQPADVLFLPVSDRSEFLKTITFETVTYQFVSDHLVAIDRPDSPYYVLFQDGYAWLGDDVAQLTAFARRREQSLARISKSVDLAFLVDLEQIPSAHRQSALESWRHRSVPWLQQRDAESAAAYSARRQGLEWLVTSLPDVAAATRQIVVTQTMGRASRRSEWRIELVVDDRHPGARSLRNWLPKATPLVRLDQPEAVAFGVIRGPETEATQNAWELGWQVFGHPYEQRTAIVTASGPGLIDAVRTAPRSGPAEMTLGRGQLRRVTLPPLPVWLRRWTGWDPEVWLGEADERVWIGFGPPDAARRRLEQAYAVVNDPGQGFDRAVCVRTRFSSRDLVSFVPGFDPGWIDQQLVRGGDQVRVSVDAVTPGLVVTVGFDVGVLRVLGAAIAHELSLELDQALSVPIEPAP